MPSPIPGIDPYLYQPRFWQNFHERFTPAPADFIQPQLLDRYWATIGERLTVEVVTLKFETTLPPVPLTDKERKWLTETMAKAASH